MFFTYFWAKFLGPNQMFQKENEKEKIFLEYALTYKSTTLQELQMAFWLSSAAERASTFVSSSDNSCGEECLL